MEAPRADQSVPDIFVLNTKTKCFLCLAEIVQQRKEFQVKNCLGNEDEDTYIKIDPEDSHQPQYSLFPVSSCYAENLSLLSIVRYLKIQWRKILNTFVIKRNGVVNYTDYDLLDKTPNISVTLCSECNVVTAQLSSSCRELEVLQMKVDYQLKCFQEVLQLSKENGERVDRFRKDVEKSSGIGGPLEMRHGDLAEILREEMINKCDSRKNSAVPRVVINRKKSSKFQIPVFKNPNSDIPKIDFNIESVIVAALGKSSSSPLVNCTHCHYRQIPAVEYEYHKIRYHMETHLTQYKLLHVSLSEFKEYCEYVVQVELLLCQVQQQNPSYSKCSNCSKVFSSSYYLRRHLLSEHGELLGKKLGELQRSTTLEEIRTTQLPSASITLMPPQQKVIIKPTIKPTTKPTIKPAITPAIKHAIKPVIKHAIKPAIKNAIKRAIIKRTIINRKSEFLELQRTFDVSKSSSSEACTLCFPPSSVKYRYPQRHIVRAHAESFFTSYKLPHISMTEFKQYCEHVLQVEQLSCEKQYKPDGTPFVLCSLCSRRFTSNIVLRGHLVLEHEQVLSSKVVELQHSTTPAEIDAATKNLSSLQMRGWTCTNCGATFSQETSLYMHRKSQCKRGNSTTTTTTVLAKGKRPRKWKSKIVHVEGHYKCNFCDQTFNTRQQKYKHKIKYHHDNIKKRKETTKLNDNIMTSAEFVESMYPKIEIEILNSEDMNPGQCLVENETFSEPLVETYQEEDFQHYQEIGYSEGDYNNAEVMLNNKNITVFSEAEDPLQ